MNDLAVDLPWQNVAMSDSIHQCMPSLRSLILMCTQGYLLRQPILTALNTFVLLICPLAIFSRLGDMRTGKLGRLMRPVADETTLVPSSVTIRLIESMGHMDLCGGETVESDPISSLGACI